MEFNGDILLIDDDPLILMNLADLVRDKGYNAITANSLTQALSALSFRQFSLVVCDHDLPDGKGLRVLDKLADADNQPPVLYLTAALPDIVEEANQFAFVKEVLFKPVDDDTFLQAIRAHLNSDDDREVSDHYPRLIGRNERRMLLDDL